MTFHPRERRIAVGIDRRTFLRRSAFTAAAVAAGPSLLAACGGDSGGGGGGGGGQAVQLSRPDNPVTLPTFDDIPMIADGLDPETGPLKIYNYAEYIAPQTLRGFRREYGVDVEVTTFTSMDEAVARLSGGHADFDLFFATTDVIGKVTAGQLLQPLNATYLGNSSNIWTQLQDPFYDVGAQYSRPYAMYGTGIGYRIDRVSQPPEGYDNPYDILWDPQYSGDLYLLEDDREVLGMAMLRRGRPTSTPRTRRRSTPPSLTSRSWPPPSTRGSGWRRTRSCPRGGPRSIRPGPAMPSTRSTTCRKASRSRTSASGTRTTAG